MVELDTYEYPTTRYGEPFTSDVSICNVFVCKVFKASGIFGDLVDQVRCSLRIEVLKISWNFIYYMKLVTFFCDNIFLVQLWRGECQ